MSQQTYTVRNAHLNEFTEIGELMVQVYSQLDYLGNWRLLFKNEKE